ncbi:MAG: hypothetical protein ACYC5K_00355 [Saccharofermentanales bacterium]
MDIRKSFFGGYKRRDVDQLVSRLTDTGNVAEAKSRILEKEIEDLRLSTKADIELISQDAESGRRRINDLKAQLDTLGRQAEELRRQIAKKDSQILQMEERCQQADKAADAYESKIREIGEIYIEAQEYSRRLKEDTKKEVAEIVDTFFGQMLQPGRSSRKDPEEIENFRGTLNEIAEGLQETSAFLKNRLDRLDAGGRQRPIPSGRLESARDDLINKVRHGDGLDSFRGESAASAAMNDDRSTPLKTGGQSFQGNHFGRPDEPGDTGTAVMPGQLEIKVRDDEEEDRLKYQQTFSEMDSGRSGDAASGSGVEQDSGSKGRSREDADADGRTEMPAVHMKKTSIREILEKYSKF